LPAAEYGSRNQRPAHNSSPDPHARIRRQIQLLAGLDAEQFVPRIDIAHGAVHAELPRRVRIADDLATHEIVAELAAPCLRPTDEYALVAGVAIQNRGRLSTKRFVICSEGQR